jgi:putative membrane protein
VRLGTGLFAAAGLALAAIIVAANDPGAVIGALARLGPVGFVWTSALHLGSIVLCAAALRVAIDPPRPNLARVLWARLCRDAGGDLLGFIPGVGEVLAIRALTLHGLAGVAATAVVVVDLTLEIVAQVLFALTGFLLAAATLDAVVVTSTAAGLAVLALAAGGVVIAQRFGIFKLIDRLSQRLAFDMPWRSPTLGAEIHARLAAIWRAPGRVLPSIAIHFAAWLAGCAEAWLALALMGVHASPLTVVAIESLVFTLRTLAFVVPGALGVQEGAYLTLAAAFGLPPETMLAVSLVKRAREIALGAPMLVSWKIAEGLRARRGRAT